MKIELDSRLSGQMFIDAYSADGVVINKTLYPGNIIVTADEVITNWPPRSISELNAEHFDSVISRSPEILLIGTGLRQNFPDLKILSPVISNNIGFEIMDTGAACRAYNFLVGENRIVIAALMQIEQN